jgi:hypothetical protein
MKKYVKNEKLKLFINNYSKMNKIVFLEGESISNYQNVTLKRLDKMGYQVFNNEVPENYNEIPIYFETLQKFILENENQEKKDNVVFIKSSFITPIIYFPTQKELFHECIQKQITTAKNHDIQVFKCFCDPIEAKTRVAYHSEYENKTKMDLVRLEKIDDCYLNIELEFEKIVKKKLFDLDQIVYTTDSKQSVYYIFKYLNIEPSFFKGFDKK